MIFRDEYPYLYVQQRPEDGYVHTFEPEDKRKYCTVYEFMKVNRKGIKRWTYRLPNNVSFHEFNHREAEEISGGRGISLREIHEIIKANNHQLQQHKTKILNEPVHVVSSYSEAGTVKIGVERPRTVIAFPDMLAIGPIKDLHSEEGRRRRWEWLLDNIRTHGRESDYESENRFDNFLLEIEDIPDNVPIFIWFNVYASGLTFLRFMMELLKTRKNPIYIVEYKEPDDQKRRELMKEKDGGVFDYIRSFMTNHLREQAVVLTSKDRKSFEQQWLQLSEEGGMLRTTKDELIKTIPLDYFDDKILRTIHTLHDQQQEKDFIQASNVVDALFDSADAEESQVGDLFIEHRIRELIIQKRKLEMRGIPTTMRHFRVKVPD